jgi:hypothetical protein
MQTSKEYPMTSLRKTDVIAGLDPAIHRFEIIWLLEDGWPGHRRSEATPFFERLRPAMTI